MATLELCSIDDVLAYPGVGTVGDNDREWLTTMIRGVSKKAETYCNRFFFAESRVQQFTTSGRSAIISLPAWGNATTDAITEVKYSWDRDFAGADTLVDATDYYFEQTSGHLFRINSPWLIGRGATRVTWVGGFGTTINDVPEDMRAAAILQVAFWWQARKDLAIKAKSFGEGGAVTTNESRELIMEVKQTFDAYERMPSMD